MTGGSDHAPGVFLSYRREDAPAHAGRLYDRLAERFGESHVFMDVDSIGLGLDWVEVLQRAVSSCEVMLVLIGPRWLEQPEPQAERRLDDPDDYVRMEVEAGLARGVRVVPILVGGASLPQPSELPEPLHALLRRQAQELTDSTFRSDVGLLIDRLASVLAPGSPTPPPAAATTAPTTQVSRPGEWSVEGRRESRRRFWLRVQLSHENHEIVITLGGFKDQILVDGRVVASSYWSLDGSHAFKMNDGAETRMAVVAIKSITFGLNTVAITIDGTRVYTWPTGAVL